MIKYIRLINLLNTKMKDKLEIALIRMSAEESLHSADFLGVELRHRWPLSWSRWTRWCSDFSTHLRRRNGASIYFPFLLRCFQTMRFWHCCLYLSIFLSYEIFSWTFKIIINQPSDENVWLNPWLSGICSCRVWCGGGYKHAGKCQEN